ncbi:hypothetical protein [Psychroflexus salis]|uniref:Uncharacterized protein n=1 Tax=Psychroflexus salis TaxID=1526574 RepID=A0A917E682_9FLAO|nr:hypothetical protein [Psychroflexus salis]GGE08474.1 hypothetical protein GCM10010831_07520 [Psychroflexus salis]
MKINLIIALVCLFFWSCNETKNKKDEATKPKTEIQQSTKFKSYVGEFIKVDNAAILKGNNFIYGVVLDSMGMELATQAETLKYDEYDMVPVVLSGELISNPNKDGWEELLEVKKIIRIAEPKMEETIEIKKPIN